MDFSPICQFRASVSHLSICPVSLFLCTPNMTTWQTEEFVGDVKRPQPSQEIEPTLTVPVKCICICCPFQFNAHVLCSGTAPGSLLLTTSTVHWPLNGNWQQNWAGPPEIHHHNQKPYTFVSLLRDNYCFLQILKYKPTLLIVFANHFHSHTTYRPSLPFQQMAKKHQ